MARLEQTAVVVSATQAEHDAAVASFEERYPGGSGRGPARGASDGVLTWTDLGQVGSEWRIELSRTIDPYEVE